MYLRKKTLYLISVDVSGVSEDSVPICRCLMGYLFLSPAGVSIAAPPHPLPPFNMASTPTLRPRHTTRTLPSFHLSLMLLLTLLTPCTAASSRRLNSRFMNLDFNTNYSEVYRALDEGMRDQRRLDAAFRSVDLGRAVNVFDVARAIIPGE